MLMVLMGIDWPYPGTRKAAKTEREWDPCNSWHRVCANCVSDRPRWIPQAAGDPSDLCFPCVSL